MPPYHSQYWVVVFHTQIRVYGDTRHHPYVLLDATFEPYVAGPWCSKPISLYHDSSKCVYTGLLLLFPTAFNHVGVG